MARRRIPKLAREVTTLDRLTGGRMILGVGLGSPIADEFGSFGETTDTRELAARLDEGLEALNLLWSGEPVTFRGDHVRIDDVVFLPTPVQRPRVPIWVGGVGPPGGRCAAPPGGTARHRSCCPPTAGRRPSRMPRPSARSASRTGCRAAAGLGEEPFDLVVWGRAWPGLAVAADLTGSLGQAGATWWAECLWEDLESAGPMIRRTEQGPPRG